MIRLRIALAFLPGGILCGNGRRSFFYRHVH